MITMADPTPTVSEPRAILRAQLRRHLEMFYALLELALACESVEAAMRMLATVVRALPKEEQVRIVSDPTLRWQQFAQAFHASGLAKKHRGIIAGLARTRSALSLSAEYDHFLNLFLT